MNPTIKDGMNSLQRLLKRAFDLVGSLLALILLSPLMGIIALLIYLAVSSYFYFHSCRKRIYY